VTMTLPPILGDCITNCSLHLPKVHVKIMGILPIIIMGLAPVQVSLGLGLVMLSLGIWALAVIVKLVGPPNEAGSATGAVGVRCVTIVIHVACGPTELAPLVAGEVSVVFWGVLLGFFVATVCLSVGAAHSSMDSSGSSRGSAAPLQFRVRDDDGWRVRVQGIWEDVEFGVVAANYGP
jgi:hypothetical protein